VIWSIGSSPILRTGAEEAFPLAGKERDAGSQKLGFDIYHNSNKQLNILKPHHFYPSAALSILPRRGHTSLLTALRSSDLSTAISLPAEAVNTQCCSGCWLL